ncbi:MAG: phosphoglycerate dehydrogenase [Phycisphaerales bacterium]
MKTSFPKNKIEIVLFESIHSDGVAELEQAGFSIRTHKGALEGDALIQEIKRAHVVGIRSKTQLTAEVLEQCERLLAVGCFCAGTNQVALGTAAAAGVPVFNSPFSNTRSVAELTIAEIVCLHRRVTERSAGAHKGEWHKTAIGSHEVRGKTLGIVGYGHIGSQISVLAEAMGMRVIYYDVASKLPLGNANQSDSLDALLAESDVVTLHVPETGTTKGLIGATELAKMKPGSYLINNARGTVIDLDALADAITNKHLAGAALDVFPDEPAKAGEMFSSPVQGLPNVILTPHIGGSTVEAQRAISVDVAQKIERFVDTGSTMGAVNTPEVDLPAQAGGVDGAMRAQRILNFHRNVPGVLGQIHRAAGELGVNVSGQYLRTFEDIGYVVIDVDPSDGESFVERINAIPETIRTRVLW